ncbi:MAG: c-type cytochrome [Gammaproteobacteria bacterium]|nr:c-type cytochrome [Gammaproteobacteria bacterium]
MTNRRRGLCALLLALSVATAAGTGVNGAPHETHPRPAPETARAPGDHAGTRSSTTEPTLSRGRAVYNARCYFCHGYAGDAKTVAATVLRPPPRDFTAIRNDAQEPDRVSRERMLATVREGRPGTAMQGFSGLLDEPDIEAVVAFIRSAFIHDEAANIRYHSRVNGWEGEPAHSPAAPFATGELALDSAWESLDETQRRGREIYLASCISCHSRGPVTEARGVEVWRNEAVTFPPGNYVEHDDHQARPATIVFERHARPPQPTAAEPAEGAHGTGSLAVGREVYARNCADCHAADGSGRNWIGSFLSPPPGDFSRPHPERPPTRAMLLRSIRDGIESTSMPAWRAVLDEHQIQAVTDYLQIRFARFADTTRQAHQD